MVIRAVKAGFALENMELVAQGGSKIRRLETSELLYAAYKRLGKSKEALEMHELFVALKDSLNDLDMQRSSLQKVLNYEFEQKALADSLQFSAQQQATNRSIQNERNVWLIGLLALIAISFGFWFIQRRRKQNEQSALRQEIQDLKAEQAKPRAKDQPTASLSGPTQLVKHRIEAAIGAPLNKTDWKILQILHEKPSIKNPEIAERVSLSRQGVSSSLRKMYRLFELRNTENQRIALVIAAVKFSGDEEDGEDGE
ncbi:MAG: winged helix-turn-helix domain-containing protein [Bacteroidota bacterium]